MQIKNNNHPMKRSSVIWMVVLIGVVSLSLFIWLWLSTLETTQDDPSEVTKSTAPTTPIVSPITTAVTNDIRTQQSKSVSAAAQATDTKPIQGIINERPDFVSEIEWQALTLVAQKNQNPAQELTRLVSNLRFNKQMDIWQSQLSNSAETTQRHALANQLLNDIPNALHNQAIDQSEAQKEQISLINDIVSDPIERNKRIEQEAALIDVKIDIQESQ